MTQPPALDITSLLSGMAAHGERPALSFYRGKTRDGRLSYEELAARVANLAGGVHGEYGVRAGDRVAILAPNRLEVPVLVLALLRLGAVVVPLNPGSAAEDWTYILRHSGARGLCVTRELDSRVPQAARPAFTLYLDDAFAIPGQPPPAAVALAEHMAVVLYTSGTTGNPKGVALRQRNLIANAWSMARNFHLRETRQLAVLPLYHAHAFGFGLMTALCTGSHLVFTERLEPFSWAQVIRAESVEVARDFEARTRIPIVQGWGLSEYTNFACCVSPDESADEHARMMFSWEVPSIGPALEGTEVRVVDGSGVAVEEGTRGELVVRGHSMMLGYFGDPENTARAIDAQGWLHTGDEGLFRMHRGRPIYFVTGRLKEIIIRDADKYSPLRLERRLVEALPEISGRVVVLGFPHREHGEEVGAYLEMPALDDALRARLAAAIEAMAVAERPKVVLHGAVPIPRTHTGKIQRRKMQPWFTKWVAHRGPTVIDELPPERPLSS